MRVRVRLVRLLISFLLYKFSFEFSDGFIKEFWFNADFGLGDAMHVLVYLAEFFPVRALDSHSSVSKQYHDRGVNLIRNLSVSVFAMFAFVRSYPNFNQFVIGIK